MKGMTQALILAGIGLGGCTTGHEPNACGSDLQVAVNGGATIRFDWSSGCEANGPREPYRDRPSTPGVP